MDLLGHDSEMSVHLQIMDGFSHFVKPLNLPRPFTFVFLRRINILITSVPVETAYEDTARKPRVRKRLIGPPSFDVELLTSAREYGLICNQPCSKILSSARTALSVFCRGECTEPKGKINLPH